MDASALVDALGAVPGTDLLRGRLATDELHAPMLLDFEVVSAVRRLALTGAMTAARAEDLLGDLDDLPVHRWPPSDALRRRAFALRDVVSAYDAAYVALAEALECPLVTRDARLARASGHAAAVELR